VSMKILLERMQQEKNGNEVTSSTI